MKVIRLLVSAGITAGLVVGLVVVAVNGHDEKTILALAGLLGVSFQTLMSHLPAEQAATSAKATEAKVEVAAVAANKAEKAAVTTAAAVAEKLDTLTAPEK